MSPFRRILVPTDFSELSNHAAMHARALAEVHRAELHAIHVVTVPTPGAIAGATPGMDAATAMPSIDSLIETSRSGMSEFIQKQLAGQDVKSEILVGQPFSEICRYASEKACDLIVIGSHARGIVHRIFMGSVSKAVLEHASCPVLMVPLAAV